MSSGGKTNCRLNSLGSIHLYRKGLITLPTFAVISLPDGDFRADSGVHTQPIAWNCIFVFNVSCRHLYMRSLFTKMWFACCHASQLPRSIRMTHHTERFTERITRLSQYSPRLAQSRQPDAVQCFPTHFASVPADRATVLPLIGR